jgi:tRNA G18 (ribose-2'-O)-methylase SpoU
MKSIAVALDNVRSALNVGAIFRTSDGAKVEKLLLGGITPYPPHPKVLKTSLGAHEYVDFEYTKDLLQMLLEYKEKGYEVFSVEETKASRDFFEIDIPEKVVFVFGNEITGVSTNIIEISDQIVELPMLGQKHSLNVATTAGIVIYNARFRK